MSPQDLPKGQQIIMWVGIVLDFVAKGSLVFELWRFASSGHWLWFAFSTLFFVVSSGVVALYWWTHYPGAIADQVVVDVLPSTKLSQQEGGSALPLTRHAKQADPVLSERESSADSWIHLIRAGMPVRAAVIDSRKANV